MQPFNFRSIHITKSLPVMPCSDLIGLVLLIKLSFEVTVEMSRCITSTEFI